MVTFEAAIAEGKKNVAGDTVKLTQKALNIALNIVSKAYPHQACESQKAWMRKCTRKPEDMKIRVLDATLSRINNCLLLFPGG